MGIVNKNLKFLRVQQGMTQKQLAEKLGLKQAAIGAYEEERATPPLTSLLDIMKIFNVNLDDLVKEPYNLDIAVGIEFRNENDLL